MACLAFDGFEGQHLHNAGFQIGGGSPAPTIDTTNKRSGAAAAKWATGTVNASGLGFTGALNRTFYIGFGLRIGAAPGATKTFLGVRSSASSSTVRPANIKIDTSRRLIGADGSTSSALTVNTWYWVELSVIADGVNWTWAVQLNGSPVGGSASGADVSTPGGISIGNVEAATGANYPDSWYDDVVIFDDQGTTNKSWPGSSMAVAALMPTADNAVGVNWTLGDGTAVASNAYESLNNTPPVGVADAGAAAGAQLRNNVGSSTAPAADADFTMQTYTAAGITGTVRATQARAEVAQTGVTNRSMAVRLVSNPADAAETSISTGSTPAGNYPTGWGSGASAGLGAIQDSPTVVLGTAPVARVGKRNSGNPALCCSLLVHVLYAVVTGPVSGTGQAIRRGVCQPGDEMAIGRRR